jgi:hypothetical protein
MFGISVSSSAFVTSVRISTQEFLNLGVVWGTDELAMANRIQSATEGTTYPGASSALKVYEAQLVMGIAAVAAVAACDAKMAEVFTGPNFFVRPEAR